MKRVDLGKILRDPETREELMVRAIYALRAMDDETMTMDRARAAYRKGQQREGGGAVRDSDGDHGERSRVGRD